jgi:hypothetical protein
MAEAWPPDYAAIFRERKKRLQGLRDGVDEGSWERAFAYYKDHPIEAIEHWCTTYDPRNLKKNLPVYLPFVLFEKQKDYIRFLQDRMEWDEEGIVEKSRDCGITWVSVAFAWWLWTFHGGANVSFGSRVERLVDKIGDNDSIFEKFRQLMRYLPKEVRPVGWNEKEHAAYMKIRNPENGSTITGEAGKNIGRGGRSTIYFIDEAAFVEYPDLVDKALSENTDCKIYASTPNGTGNPFYRKRFSGKFPVFTFHWHDDPRKDDAWYQKKKNTLEPEVLAQEVDLDYEASAGDVVCPALHVRVSQELRKFLKREGLLPHTDDGVAGLDVGAGAAPSVFVARFGPMVEPTVAWTLDDSINTAGRAEELSIQAKCLIVKFDSIGVGRGVASAFKRLALNEAGVRFQGVNSGDSPTRTKWPDKKRAKQKFVNLKAEMWWIMRDRLRATYEHWLHLNGEGGIEHDLQDLILLPDDVDLASQLSLPQYMKTETGKIQIESKKSMAARGVLSPDHADALILTFAPVPVRRGSTSTVGHW